MPPKPTRVRRSPEMARENILVAAEALLREQGPQALKLTDVARAAGIAHATVLHHFGSIAEVQAALMEKMIRELVDELLASEPPGEDQMARVMSGSGRLFDVLGQKGAARLAAWLEMTGEARRLTMVHEAVSEVAQRRTARDGASPEVVEDLILVSIVLALGVGLFGASLEKMMEKPEGRAREMALDLLRSQVRVLTGQAGEPD
jgi:AcrR family transcriptional regulator